MKQNKKYDDFVVDFTDLKKTINEMVSKMEKLPDYYSERIGGVEYKIPNGYKLVKCGKKVVKKRRKRG